MGFGDPPPQGGRDACGLEAWRSFEIYVLWGGDVTGWLCTNRCWGNMDAN
jgi:hypothetical protein